MKSYAIAKIKETFSPGIKIKLINMDDVQAPPTDTIGVVDFVDDAGTIHMKWENGSTLGIIYGLDEFEIIKE